MEENTENEMDVGYEEEEDIDYENEVISASSNVEESIKINFVIFVFEFFSKSNSLINIHVRK